mmetsp:Transcript_71911/g.124866  ORF Transcript_71911/g.124866 Transcript_71911/m.124866 type:complete len:323 (-) Transcript_71911:217-1185(-)
MQSADQRSREQLERCCAVLGDLRASQQTSLCHSASADGAVGIPKARLCECKADLPCEATDENTGSRSQSTTRSSIGTISPNCLCFRCIWAFTASCGDTLATSWQGPSVEFSDTVSGAFTAGWLRDCWAAKAIPPCCESTSAIAVCAVAETSSSRDPVLDQPTVARFLTWTNHSSKRSFSSKRQHYQQYHGCRSIFSSADKPEMLSPRSKCVGVACFESHLCCCAAPADHAARVSSRCQCPERHRQPRLCLPTRSMQPSAHTALAHKLASSRQAAATRSCTASSSSAQHLTTCSAESAAFTCQTGCASAVPSVIARAACGKRR